MTERRIYLDHNATTPLHPEVQETMKEAMAVFGNPSSLHAFGREARHLVEESREKIAAFIGASPEEIIFTGSGSEANNTVLSMFSCISPHCAIPAHDHRQILTTTIEHPCILEASKCLKERGGRVNYVPVDPTGKVKVDELERMMTGRTGMVSVMMANNEIGTIQDITTIARLAHEGGALFHTDAVQAVGKIPVNVKDLDADFLTFSAHKIYGPKGVGAVYVRKNVSFCPLIRGGHQEQGRRAGTENTLGIIGFARAIEMRAKEMEEEARRLKVFKETLSQGIIEKIPDVRFNGHPEDSLPNTLNVSFEGAEGEAILLYLDLEGIAVSTGSACASGSLDPSHVLLATGLDPVHAHGAIRISMGRATTMEDMAYVLEKFPLVIKKIRGMSSAYRTGGKT